MSPLQNSQAIFDQRVYAQDTEPADKRDGVIWVDTSVSPRETYVYSKSSGRFETIREEASGSLKPSELSNVSLYTGKDGTINLAGEGRIVQGQFTSDDNRIEIAVTDDGTGESFTATGTAGLDGSGSKYHLAVPPLKFGVDGATVEFRYGGFDFGYSMIAVENL